MTAKDAEEGGDKQEHEPIFLKKMQASAPGRDIVEWTCAVDTVMLNQGRSGCGRTHVHDYVRNFCRHFQRSEMCLGLPAKPRPFVTAVLNMGGIKRMVYDDDVQLVMLMVITNAESTERIQRGVQKVINRALENRDKGMTLFFAYSGPLFKEADHIYWELHTMQRKTRTKKSGSEEVEIDDGNLVFTSGTHEPRMASRTLDSDYQDTRIKEAEMVAFQRTFCAANLDVRSCVMIDALGQAAMQESTAQARLGKMQELARVLAADRDKAIQNLSVQKKEFEKKVQNEKDEGRVVAAKIAEKAGEAKRIADTQYKALQETNKTQGQQIKGLETIKELLQSQKNGAELLITTERTTLMAKVGIAEQQAKDAKAALTQASKHHENSMNKLEKSNARTVEEQERQLASLKMELRLAKDKKNTAEIGRAKVEALLERAQNERDAALADAESSREEASSTDARRSKREKILARVQAERTEALEEVEGCKEETKVYKRRLKLSTGLLLLGADRFKAVHGMLLASYKSNVDARIEAENKVEELKQHVTQDPAAASSPTVDTSEIHVQTDMMQEMFEIGELKTENVKLQDKLIRLQANKTDVDKDPTSQTVCTDAKASGGSGQEDPQAAGSGPAPASPVPTGAPAAAAAANPVDDLASQMSQSLDATAEALIEQAEVAHRALVAIARKSILNKQMADEFSSKYTALQQVHQMHVSSGMQMGPQGVFPFFNGGSMGGPGMHAQHPPYMPAGGMQPLSQQSPEFFPAPYFGDTQSPQSPHAKLVPHGQINVMQHRGAGPARGHRVSNGGNNYRGNGGNAYRGA